MPFLDLSLSSENEFSDQSAAGLKYVKWAIQMAEALDTGTPSRQAIPPICWHDGKETHCLFLHCLLPFCQRLLPFLALSAALPRCLSLRSLPCSVQKNRAGTKADGFKKGPQRHLRSLLAREQASPGASATTPVRYCLCLVLPLPLACVATAFRGEDTAFGLCVFTAFRG